jgi:hypothetical protein
MGEAKRRADAVNGAAMEQSKAEREAYILAAQNADKLVRSSLFTAGHLKGAEPHAVLAGAISALVSYAIDNMTGDITVRRIFNAILPAVNQTAEQQIKARRERAVQ